MAAGKGLMLMLDDPKGGSSGGEFEDDFDDLDDELGEDSGAPTGPTPAFRAYAETALGTADTAQVDALHEAIRTVLEQGGGLMGGMGGAGGGGGLGGLGGGGV